MDVNNIEIETSDVSIITALQRRKPRNAFAKRIIIISKKNRLLVRMIKIITLKRQKNECATVIREENMEA